MRAVADVVEAAAITIGRGDRGRTERAAVIVRYCSAVVLPVVEQAAGNVCHDHRFALKNNLHRQKSLNRSGASSV
jgi:hypothetical protein